MKVSFILAGLLLFNIGCSSDSKKTYLGLGAESVNEKTLAKYQPQPLPQEVSRKIQSYLDIRSPGMGMLSAKNDQLFFTWSITGTNQAFRLDRPQSFPVQLTGGEDRTTIEEVTPDGKYLILSRDRNGEENPGLYLQSIQGGPLAVIQHKTKVQTHFGFVTKDSKYIYYRANDIKPDSFAIYKYDIQKKTAELLFSQDGYWMISDHQDDGRMILTKALTNVASEHYEWNPKTKVLSPIIGQGEQEDYSVQYLKTPGQYLVLTNKISDFKKLYVWDLKKLKPIADNHKWDISTLSISPNRERIAYSVNEAGYTKTFVISGVTFKKISFPQFPGADHVMTGQFSHDSQNIIVAVMTAKKPRLSHSYNFQTGKLTSWLFPSSPEVDTQNFAESKLEYYLSRDGVKIPMFVRRPKQCENPKREKPCSVVVHFHGGPEAQSTPGFSVTAQLFVDEDLIFVEPNVRGSEGYGKAWLHMDDKAKRLQVVTDIADAASFIKKNWAVNGVAPKVGIMGWSYGGYSTLYAMTKFAGSYDAGVALVGMSNLLTFLENTAPYRRALRTPEYGDPVQDREALIELSPMTHLKNIQSPLMIIQGATDPRVPVGEAVQIHESLVSKGIASPLVIFADEGHGAAKRSNKVLELGHTLNFLKTNLQ